MHSCPAWSTGEFKDCHSPGKMMLQAILQLLYHFLISCVLVVGKAVLQKCIVNGVQDPSTKTRWCPVVKLPSGHSFLLSSSRSQQKTGAVLSWLYPS